MNEVCEKNSCTGCGACRCKCPCGAIVMQENGDGVTYPLIDRRRCVDCGLCRNVCPVHQPLELNPEPAAVYAGWAVDDAIRQRSSSGGLFSVLARRVLRQGGAVNGTVFTADFRAVHKIIRDDSELASLRGSKYVHSEIGDVYAEIAGFLCTGKPFLFTGLPCQVAGLYTFLGGRPKNLFTCDILCHGCPPPKMFRRYLDWVSDGKGVEQIQVFHFRDYAKWHYQFSWRDAAGAQNVVPVKHLSYQYAFMKGLGLRENCYTCHYARTRRGGDLTLGDFWGVGQFRKISGDLSKGCSMILVNSEKGEALLESVKSELTLSRRELAEALRENHRLRYPTPRPDVQEQFLRDFYSLNEPELIQKYGLKPQGLLRKLSGIPLRISWKIVKILSRELHR